VTDDAGDPRDDAAATAPASSVEGTVSTVASATGVDVGARLGHFRVDARIGEGGLGIVYRAYDEKLKRDVALKVLAERSGTQATRLLEEARAAASMSHPSIAAIHDVRQYGGVAFIVMELVPGATLRALIQRGPIDWRTALRYARDIASGLARAHRGGIVHRDLKPENVMITPEGSARILDFGLARAAVESPPSSRAGTAAMLTGAAGTPAYMAPEQTRGRPVDARADVFSFGVVLYEMLCAKRPFARPGHVAPDDADGPASDEWRVVTPVEQAAPDVPPAVAGIVARCLAKERAARFADGSELAEALRAADDGATPGRGAARGPRSKRALLVAVAVAVAGAVGLGALGLLVTVERGTATVPPPAPSASASARPASSSSQALAAYSEALQAERTGNDGAARKAFRAAVAADPAMAAAWLRLALALFFTTDDSTGARDALGHVGPLAGTLDDRDRALFDAAAPLVLRDPADWDEHLSRLRAASERFAADPEIVAALATSLSTRGQWAEAAAAAGRAMALDPHAASPYGVEAVARSMLGDTQGALAAADACEANVPTSTKCIEARESIHEQAGDCAALEADGRAEALRDASSGGYYYVAEALASEDRSAETIQGAIDLYLANVPAKQRPELSAYFTLLFAIWRGDFATAEDWIKKVDAENGSDAREEERGVPLMLLAALYDEEGRHDDARRTAAQFVERQPNWLAYKRYTADGLAFTAVPEMLSMARTAASAGDLDARRDAWAREWGSRVSPVTRSLVWLAAYAAPAKSAADAKHALDVLPDYQPLPEFRPSTMWTSAEGHVYLLAGDAARAAPLLEKGARVCISIHDPFNRPQTRLALGKAREALGDAPRACEAYAAVTAQWGKARPRSVTAAEAAARAAALRCGGGR
jgi:tetratricopeptide (TPR) repeat protein